MKSYLSLLSEQLSLSPVLKAKNEFGDILKILDFPYFKAAIKNSIFSDHIVKESSPSKDKMLKAIALLKSNSDTLSKKDWRLVFWGLNERVSNEPSIMESDFFFSIVSQKVEFLTVENSLNRREWFALLASYFSFSNLPEQNKNSLKLQHQLVAGFLAIEKKQLKSKPWILFVRNNFFLLNPAPDRALSKMLIDDSEKGKLSSIRNQLPISANSWLWEKVFKNLSDSLNELTDINFYKLIPLLIGLIEDFSLNQNGILTAILKRYYKSIYSKQTHQELKVLSSEMWGGPQISTSKNRWLVYVSNDELSMVQSWFARDDLEHFFKLLKSDVYVDQRRLDFWLDYVDQISFTRMVLGRDALYNNSTDFEDFKKKNKGRLSELLSAGASNNAFIMQIKDYWFVEFSETGNACYVYENNKLPFNELDKKLDLKNELKCQDNVINRIFHSGSWEEKATDYLTRLSIVKNSG